MSDGSAGTPGARRDLLGWIEQRLNLTELFSFVTHFGFIYTSVDNRRPLREVTAEIGALRVPAYARWPQVLGVLIAILFALEALTGMLLTFYYHPTAETAYRSTRAIVRDVPAGGFIHQMHHWGAYLLVGVVVIRLVRLFWDGLYRAPRELLWLSAVILAWLVVQLDFTGRLLTWDIHSYWSTVRGLEVVHAIPIVGPLLGFLVGGQVVNDDVLIRFYVVHIMVLPALYVGGVFLTFATLRRVGLSVPADPRSSKVTTFHRHTYDLAILTLLLFAGLVTLASLVPFRFLGAADPYVTPGGIRPPWYMLAGHALLSFLPGPDWLIGLPMLAVALAVTLLPFWIQRVSPGGDSRRVRVIGLAAFGLWLVLTVLGLLADRK
jgi:ubiquinol-cytochrome c reductase cytochrome b subunit